jgi:hypothetical protein
MVILTALSCLLLTNRGLTFGNEGHETIGAIADELIQGTPAEVKVKALLPDMTLLEAATWADRAKGGQGLLTAEMKAFDAANPDHRDYHYTDVPIQETHYQLGTHGTKPIDVVQITTQCINVLKGNNTPGTNPHGFSPRIALILLVHFVGDLHQPLHVGALYLNTKKHPVDPNTYSGKFQDDRGGNYLRYKSGNLHAYWDGNAVKRAMTKAGAKTPGQYATAILQSTPVVARTTGAVETWPAQWADDILAIAAKAHKGFKYGKTITVTNSVPTHLEWPVTAPSGYDKLARDTVDERITVGGYRLAQLLQAIAP